MGWELPDHYSVHSFLLTETEVDYYGSVEATDSQIGGDGFGKVRSMRFSTEDNMKLRVIDYAKLVPQQ